jgi:hypothetical protein
VRKSFALLCCLLVAGALARPARAAAAEEGPTIALVDMPAAVGPTDALPLQLKVAPGDLSNLDVRVTLHDDLNTRSGFEQTVAGAELGDDIDRVDVPLGDLAAKRGVVTVRLGMPDAYVPSDLVLHPTRTGVYPLEVALRRDGTQLDSFVTWLVYVRSGTGAEGRRSITEPLSFSWVWSVVAPPAREADGTTPSPDVLSQMIPGGRLARIATLLARADNVPITLDVSPETLQSWLDFARERDQLKAGASAVRVAAGARENQLLPAPYVPIDLPAFLHAGLGRYYSDELVEGAEKLQELTGARIDDSRIATIDPVDDAALQRLRELLFDRVVVREDRLPSQQPNLTPARPFVVATDDGGQLDATSSNATIAKWLEGDEAPALRAQRFLAGLSLVALEAPADPRGIVVTTPRDWSPDVTAVTKVLRGLRTDPLLRAVTLNDYFSDVPADTTGDDDTPLVRKLLPQASGSYPITAFEYQQARDSLNSFRGVVGPTDPSVVRGERALLIALSSLLTPAQAHQELGVIDHAASSFLGQISVTQQRVTLTARKAQIPLTFSNQTAQPVRVRVSLAAPSGKALFPDGAQQLITLAPGIQTKRFLVEARATGTFAMTVTLTSEDGQLSIGAPTEITVRSTVFSGWGAMLTVGALVFLAGWWANHIWRSRRAMRHAAAV